MQAGSDPWDESSFQWIRSLPPRTKGAVGEEIVARWVEEHGGEVERTGDSEADRIVNGRRIEIKMSTLWKSGVYRFQQVRDQNYEHLIALGLSPTEVHLWVISKVQLLEHVIGKTGQHTGSEGTDTAWIACDPGSPPTWMKDCGGTLGQAWDVIAAWSNE